MLRFEPARLLFIKDIERCPYIYNTQEAMNWYKLDTKRELLIALERYLMIFDYLNKTDQYLKD